MKEKKKKASVIPNPVPPAGMRADSRQPVTGAPCPHRDSLMDEIRWRVEHQQ